MNNRQKMEHHLHRAEVVQQQVEMTEERALARAQQDPRNVGQGALYVAGRDLDTDMGYRALVAKRNAHEVQAQMYGIAAILEAIEGFKTQ